MKKSNEALAEAYYTAVSQKKTSDIGNYFHPDAVLKSPLGNETGKAAVVEAASRFAMIIKSLKIRAKFASDNQAMVVYDVEFPGSIGNLSSAALLTYKDELIVGLELFYDARPLEKMIR